MAVKMTSQDSKVNVKWLMKQSQFHGVKRLIEKRYTFFWIVAFIFLLGAAISSLLVMIWRHQSSPTFLAKWEIYRMSMKVPAVLLCPELNFPHHKMEEFLQKTEFPPDLNKTYVRSVLRQLAAFYSLDIQYTVKDLENLERFLEYNGLDVERATKMLTSTCSESLLRCRFEGAVMDCNELFTMELAEYGYCCVFNGRSVRRDLKEYGGPVLKPNNQLFTSLIGYRSGLMFAVNRTSSLADLDLSYKWILVLGAQHFVDALLSNGSAISPGKEIWMGVMTRGIHVSPMTRLLDTTLRRCRLNEEAMTNFPVYRKDYCRVECEMAAVMKQCNCLLLPHPSKALGLYCKARSLPCAQNVARKSESTTCSCFPTCNYEYEDLKTSEFDLETSEIKPIDTFYDGLNFKEVTVIRVFLSQREVNQKSRQAYFTFYDLFAQMGGIFNVFFGCSILSLFEIFQLLWHGLQKDEPKITKSKKKQKTILDSKVVKENAPNKRKVNKNKNKKKVRFC